MEKLKFSLYFAVFLVLITGVFSATISGTIYNLNLEKLDDAVVGINTEPVQKYIAKNGTYMFNLNPGQYTMIAFKTNVENLEITQKIKIDEEGDYLLDLILFPTLREEEELLNITQFDIGDEYFEKDYTLYWIIAIIGIVVFLVIAYFILSPKKTEKKEIQQADAETGKVIEFIKKQGGRTTQKDIRKQFPSSEAKISLIITELEKKGKIEKIKKGRGNIIKLK